MVQHAHLIPKVSEEGIVEEFESPFLKKMAEDLQVFYAREGRLDLAEALGRLEDDLKEDMCAFAFRENDLEGTDLERILDDCIQNVRGRRLTRDKKELLKRIKEAEGERGKVELEALLAERQELAKKESRLLKKITSLD